jgi:hypothetical protein
MLHLDASDLGDLDVDLEGAELNDVDFGANRDLLPPAPLTSALVIEQPYHLAA